MSVSAEEPARPERARVVRLRRVAFRAQLDGPAREDDHQLREHYAVLSGAGTSGARKFEILREGLPEYGKTCRSAAQLAEAPLQLRLLSLLACSSALQAARSWLRDVSLKKASPWEGAR